MFHIPILVASCICFLNKQQMFLQVGGEHCSTFSLIVQGLPIINVTLIATEIVEFTSLYEIDIVK
jgi:hypothetical protein